MRGYDLHLINKQLTQKDLLQMFCDDYLLLFAWIHQDIISHLPDSCLPVFQVIAQEIICAGAGCYWAYGPDLSGLQVVSLHDYAKRLNYQLEPDILLEESIETFRRSEHMLSFILATDWTSELDASYSYYFDQLKRLIALVRQSAEQLELLHYAAETKPFAHQAIPTSPPNL